MTHELAFRLRYWSTNYGVMYLSDLYRKLRKYVRRKKFADIRTLYKWQWMQWHCFSRWKHYFYFFAFNMIQITKERWWLLFTTLLHNRISDDNSIGLPFTRFMRRQRQKYKNAKMWRAHKKSFCLSHTIVSKINTMADWQCSACNQWMTLLAQEKSDF